MNNILLALLLASSISYGKTAPSFRGELLSGGKISLEASVKSDRLLFLSFWATWCIPCMQELTEISNLLKAEPSLPMDLITVNIDRESRSEIPATMRENGFSFPVVLDPTGDIYGKYQKTPTLPFSVLVNPSKEIVETFNGYHETMIPKIRAAIAKLKGPGK